MGPYTSTCSGLPLVWGCPSPRGRPVPVTPVSTSQADYLHLETPNPFARLAQTLSPLLPTVSSSGQGAKPPRDLLLEPQTTFCPSTGRQQGQQPNRAEGGEQDAGKSPLPHLLLVLQGFLQPSTGTFPGHFLQAPGAASLLLPTAGTELGAVAPGLVLAEQGRCQQGCSGPREIKNP